jgi:hypothetical protein
MVESSPLMKNLIWYMIWYNTLWYEVQQRDPMQDQKHWTEVLYPCLYFFYSVTLYLLGQISSLYSDKWCEDSILEAFEVNSSSESEVKT